MSPTSTGASAVETSGSTGIIIGVIVGVMIVVVLALVFWYRRQTKGRVAFVCICHRRKPPGGEGNKPTAGIQLITITPAKVAQQARITDVADEPLELMGPITGVMKCVRLSLMDAAAASGVEDIDAHAFMASEAGAQLAAADPHGLDADEAGGLWLYTAQSEFYPTLNQLLRNRDRSALIPFFPYLQLMLTARSKLPKYNGPVWRGVKGVDLRDKYPKDKEVWWWAFSSTTKQLQTLTNPMFLGTSGVRTVFMIEIVHGVDLQRYSAFQGVASEAEVLLYPGTKLKVVGSMEMGGGLFQVHLKEMPPAVAVFK